MDRRNVYLCTQWGINVSSNLRSVVSINKTENSTIYGNKMASLTPTNLISTSNPCEAEIKQKI